MDFQAEYKEFFEQLGPTTTYAYKFFDLFRVTLGNGEDEHGNVMEKGLYWCKNTSDTELTDEQLRELKLYLKQTKSWLRKEKKNVTAKDCRKKMWFFTQKLMEFGAFERGDRREIVLWMDNFNFLNGVKVVYDEKDE